ncbi:MAG: InlB B-repeat-containing protein [Oscillospiraceae bacterium]|nr:InlB B-repeat-containing protein [Oscillospiraceae bacterium]
MKKILSVLLALVMIVGMLPMSILTASAAEETVALSFADKANRTTFTTSQQIWEQNGIKLTNNKKASTSNVADYAKPARFYASSELIVECAGMKSIVFDCNSSSYATTMKTSIGTVSGATVATSSDKVTVTFTSAVDSFTVAKLSGQVRMDSISVTCEVASVCEHPEENLTVETIPATCTEKGSIVTTCSCGKYSTTEVVPALGHNYVDGICENCDGDLPASMAGRYYIAGLRTKDGSTYHYMTNDLGTATTSRYQAVDTLATELPESIVSVVANQVFVLVQNVNTGKYTIYAESVEGDNYLGWKSENEGRLVAEADALALDVDANEDGTYYIHFDGGSDVRYLALNNNTEFNYFAFYPFNSAAPKLHLVPVSEDAAVCGHANTNVINGVDATCTEGGYSGDTVCADCGAVLEEGAATEAAGHTYGEWVVTTPATCTEDGEQTKTCTAGDNTVTETIPATGHNFVDNICTNCGVAEVTYTVSFEVPGGIEAIEPMEYNGNPLTLPTPAAPEGYTFVGWTAEEVEDTTEQPEVYTEDYHTTGDVTLYALYTWGVAGGEAEFVKTDLSAIKGDDVVVITMSSTTKTYALTSAKGSSAAPTAVVMTVDGDKLTGTIEDALKWNIIKNLDESMIIYPNGDTTKWLYSTDANNGVRVGTNTNKNWSLDASGYLKVATPTVRYLGVYVTNPDWRAYNNTTGNTKDQTLAFYVETASLVSHYTTQLCTHANTETVTEEATCLVDGKETVTCADCGALISETVLTAPGHTMAADEIIGATCITYGYQLYICDDCGYEEERDIVDALGHTVVDGFCSVCTGEIYTLSTKLNEGDSVVIYNPSNKVAMGVNTNSYGDKLVGVATADVNGFAVLDSMAAMTVQYVKESTTDFYLLLGDQYLTSGATGNSLTFTAEANEYSIWYLEVASEADGLVYIHSRNAKYTDQTSGTVKDQSLEYYNNFTTFSKGTSNAYKMSLYVKAAPVPADPTVEITHISLDTEKTALGFKATATNLPEGAHVEISLWVDENQVVTRAANSLRLINIMQYNGGQTTIYAKATIVDAEGNVIAESAKVKETSMRNTVELINETWINFTDEQKASVQKMCTQEAYADIFAAWDIFDILGWENPNA